MLNWLKERQIRGRTAQELYGSIVAQARRPEFYSILGVPDTARGRFEVITLHVALVLRRLQAEGPAGAHLGRVLSETFVSDMDDNMREMSFSDLAVPREVKKTAAALFDRHAALAQLGEAPPAGADPLGERLAEQLRYLAGTGDGVPLDGAGLARYVRAAFAALSAQPLKPGLERGLEWPTIPQP